MEDKLQKIGLSKTESETYLALWDLKETSANKLSKHTSINRTVVYNTLQRLIQKGLVSYIIKSNKRFYTITKPEALLSSVKEKELITKSLIKELNDKSKLVSASKSVQIYEGKESMRNVFEFIRKAKGLRVINATGMIFEYLKYSAKHIVNDISLKKDAKVIACQSLKKSPLARFKKIKFKYLPASAENLATTFIFEDFVVIQVLKGVPFLIKIKSKEISEGYRKDFDVLWERL